VRDYRLRQPDQKRHAVNALQRLNFRVIAAGDSYNDTGMLGGRRRRLLHPPAAGHRGAVPAVPGAPRLRRAGAAIDGAAARLDD
jgi:phosphoserine / homoserine phosphotransferase